MGTGASSHRKSTLWRRVDPRDDLHQARFRQDLGKIQARYGKMVPGWYHTRVVRFCLLQSVQELSAQEILDNHSQGKSHCAILRNGAALSVRRRWGLMGLMGLGGCHCRCPKHLFKAECGRGAEIWKQNETEHGNGMADKWCSLCEIETGPSRVCGAKVKKMDKLDRFLRPKKSRRPGKISPQLLSKSKLINCLRL